MLISKTIPKLEKISIYIMEIIKFIHDLTFALVVVAVVMSPHAISTYLYAF